MNAPARRSRRYAIAFYYCCDVNDLERYQPGRTTIPVYLGGADYLVALREGEAPPTGIADTWKHEGDAYGYRIMRGTS